MIVRDPNEVVRPAAGSILCRSKRVIIYNDESKSRHRVAREPVRRDGGKLEKKKSRGIGGGTRVRVAQRGSRGVRTVLSSSLVWAGQESCHEPLELTICEKA